MVISPKKLTKMAKKWQRLASIRRKRIAFTRTIDGCSDQHSSSSVADKGHFVVYTADQRRFVIPLVYLNNDIVKELLKMAEEEYGLQIDGPIKLPCDSIFMEYAVSLIKNHPSKHLERALLTFMASGRCLTSSYIRQEQTAKPILIRGF